MGVAVCDALIGDDVRRAVDVAAGDDGLDIAVTVPGGGPYSPVLGYGDDDFDDAIRANVRPQFLAIKYAGSSMVRSGGGSIVAISSTVAFFPMPFNAGYAAGKTAVDMLVRIAADELGGANVRVNAVRPGLTETDTTRGSSATTPSSSASSSNSRSSESAGPTTSRRRFATSPGRSRAGSRASA